MSFFGTLKEELIYREKFDSRIRATLAIFEYIEVLLQQKALTFSVRVSRAGGKRP